MLTVPEAAERAGISESRIRRLIAEKQIPASKFGAGGRGCPWMISPAALERFMATPRPHGVNRAYRGNESKSAAG